MIFSVIVPFLNEKRHIERSILSPGVKVAPGAVVRNSIVMDGAVIGSNSVIERSILDKEVNVGDGCYIGYGDDYRVNRRYPKVLHTGLSIVGKRTQVPPSCTIGRNCIIYDSVAESDFAGSDVSSGDTIRPRRRPVRIQA